MEKSSSFEFSFTLNDENENEIHDKIGPEDFFISNEVFRFFNKNEITQWNWT